MTLLSNDFHLNKNTTEYLGFLFEADILYCVMSIYNNSLVWSC